MVSVGTLKLSLRLRGFRARVYGGGGTLRLSFVQGSFNILRLRGFSMWMMGLVGFRRKTAILITT